MSSRATRLIPFLLVAIATACSPATDQDIPGLSAEPSFEFASGLSVAFIPDGFLWVWNEGHETATFHVFQTEDESEQLAIGLHTSPPTPAGSFELELRGEREFDVYGDGGGIRVTETIDHTTRIDVLSETLDRSTLLDIAEAITYTPTNN